MRLGLLLAAGLGVLLFAFHVLPEMRRTLLAASGVGICSGVIWRIFFDAPER